MMATVTSRNMTRGLIPLPPITRRLIPDSQNRAWNNLGQRTIKGVVIHRMQGTLHGTDGWFRLLWQSNGVPGGGQLGLTDLGIDHQSGEIFEWNDATGKAAAGVSPNRSPFASGPVSAPYGDGLAFVQKYGVAAVNRDQRSIEISGYFKQPGEVSREDAVAQVTFERAAQVIAHDAHDYGIPWEQFPIAPQDGFSFVRWHHEFTAGTGKLCPGELIMAATDEATDFLFERVREVMKRYQTGEIGPGEPSDGSSRPAPLPEPPVVIFAQFKENTTFTTVRGATGRVYGNRSAPIRRIFAAGEKIVCAGYYYGEAVAGDPRWLMLAGEDQLRIHVSGVTEAVPVPPAIPAAR